MAEAGLVPGASVVGCVRSSDGPPPLDSLRFGRSVFGDLDQAERREWWIANRLGGYAAGTLAGSLTRRYHGLLIAPVTPPLGRRLVFAKADALLIDGDGPSSSATPLFTNRWRSGAVAPTGYLGIESFALDRSVPVWVFAAANGRRVEHRIWMEPGANTTWVAWRLLPDGMSAAGSGPRLRVTLLVNDRDHNGDTWSDGFRPDIAVAGDALRITDAGLFTLTLRAPGGSIVLKDEWYRDFALPVEASRGLNAVDHHLCVGEVTLPLSGDWCGVVAALGPGDEGRPPDFAAALDRRLAHDRAVLGGAAARRPALRDALGWVGRLVLASDAFLFARPLPDMPDMLDGQSVIAGYPWFGDWGRDTMISLPGLTLATWRPETTARILETFARFVSQGMLPNVFPGAGDQPEYNTADASLWFFEAWRAYVEARGDEAALRRVFPVLADMVAWHLKGTRYGIGADAADGLLRAGPPGVQLTWMDAKVGDWVVTPRIGKPVEINALWSNALRVMAAFAARLGEVADPFTSAADAAQKGFRRFVRGDGQGLFDVLDGPDGGGNDASVRPNQIFAVALPCSPLPPEAQAEVVRACRDRLLTSYGLRSLAPGSRDYHPSYGGDVRARDGGYHQGPVWAWLLGFYARALHRVTGDAAAARSVLEPMRDVLRDQAIGTVGEIFDGDAPHYPRGAPAQAWSVACTLDAWLALGQERA